MNIVKNTIILSVAMGLVACGGPAKTSKKGMSKLAAEAPPPPSGAAKPLNREVTRAAEKDFEAAVNYYQEQDKSGWNQQTCTEASRRFGEVADKYKSMVEARFNAGLALQNCGMLKDAESQYHSALKINPGHAPSLSNLGEIYFKGNNEARAREYWDKAVNSDGKIVAARNNLAWLMIRDIRDGKLDLASKQKEVERQLSSALAVDNDNVEAYTLYALLYVEGSARNKSRLTLAKLLLEKGAEINDKYAPLHNAQGLLLLKQDNVPRALESFRQAAALDPKFAEARMNVGNIVLGFRKYEEAKAEFEAVLKLQPKNYEALIGLGYAQRGLKDYAGAEATYNAAKKIDGSRAEADFNIGVLYKDFKANATEDLRAAQGAFRTASTHFKQAMSKSTASPELKNDAKENLEDCDKNVKSLDEAIKFQEQMKSGSSAAPEVEPANPAKPS